MSQGRTVFTIHWQETETFSRLSGDVNPLHLDAVTARRSMFGRCVVHGIHLFLRALEGRAESEPSGRHSIVALRLRLLRPAFHDAPITAEYATTGDATDLTITDETGTRLADALIVEQPAAGDDGELSSVRPAIETPRSLRPEEASGFIEEGPLALDRAFSARLFPFLLERHRPVQLAELLASTRIVGMKCPGLYSTLTGMHLRRVAAERSTNTASFRAADLHRHTGRLRVAMEGPTLAGEIEAFFRPREVFQPSFCDVKTAIGMADMAGRHVLVVGGSRGLGELAAKISAARGARVVLTYRVGETDARRVCSEIVQGGGLCEAMALDVLESRELWRVPHGFIPTDVLYFATPHIGAGGKTFDPQRLRDFCAVYVDGFAAVVDFAGQLAVQGLRVFYPSTIFIDSGQGPAEYVAAKAAGEVMARSIATRPGFCVHSVRLPPLATDETVTFIGAIRAPAIPTLLAALRGPGETS